MHHLPLPLPMEYILDSLSAILAQRIPTRQHTGALVEFASLDKSEKFLKFPSAVSADYIKKYPSAKRRTLRVGTILTGSPAEGVLFPGDIIISINGQSVGPNLYEMDKQINAAKAPLTFEVYRYGEKVSVSVKTYNLQKHKIDRLVIAGGAVFYMVDDSVRLQTGMHPESILVTNVQRGGSFYYAPIPTIPETDKTLIRIERINQAPIKKLDDVVTYFSALKGETELSILYSNFGYYYSYSQTFMFNQQPQLTEVTYDPKEAPLMIFEFSPTEKDWVKR